VSIEGAEYFAERDAQAAPQPEPVPAGSAEH